MTYHVESNPSQLATRRTRDELDELLKRSALLVPKGTATFCARSDALVATKTGVKPLLRIPRLHVEGPKLGIRPNENRPLKRNNRITALKKNDVKSLPVVIAILDTLSK